LQIFVMQQREVYSFEYITVFGVTDYNGNVNHCEQGPKPVKCDFLDSRR